VDRFELAAVRHELGTGRLRIAGVISWAIESVAR